MPTIFTHPAVSLLKSWCPRVSRRAVPAGALLTILPDADVAAFAFGIPYEHMLGHRGFTHSIVFAPLSAGLATLAIRTRTHRAATYAFLFLCAISHPLLDALTNGGLGVALFAPFTNERYFFPWTPIRVSPIGPNFFSARGLATIVSELKWVWLPCVAVAIAGRLLARRAQSPAAAGT